MIVKIQMPLSSNMQKPKALVYNEERSFEAYIEPDPKLIRLMRGRPKVFFHIERVKLEKLERLNILAEAPWQEW